MIACFPVYRTYVTATDPVSPADAQHLHRALRCAKERMPGVSSYVFDFIERLLLKKTPAASEQECGERATFIGKFQQITSPVAAKGIEDTAYYLYNRLLSLNEVGANPIRFGREPWTSIGGCPTERQYPSALSTTSTHWLLSAAKTCGPDSMCYRRSLGPVEGGRDAVACAETGDFKARRSR